MDHPISKTYYYHVPIAHVWNAFVDTNKMKAWYFPQLQRFEPIVGYTFQFDDAGSEYQKEWIVTQVIQGKTLAHSWAYKGYSGLSEVVFNMTADGDTTVLTVTQTGLESFPDHPHFQRERFEWGWDNLLGQKLKQLLEETDPPIKK